MDTVKNYFNNKTINSKFMKSIAVFSNHLQIIIFYSHPKIIFFYWFYRILS